MYTPHQVSIITSMINGLQNCSQYIAKHKNLNSVTLLQEAPITGPLANCQRATGRPLANCQRATGGPPEGHRRATGGPSQGHRQATGGPSEGHWRTERATGAAKGKGFHSFHLASSVQPMEEPPSRQPRSGRGRTGIQSGRISENTCAG